MVVQFHPSPPVNVGEVCEQQNAPPRSAPDSTNAFRVTEKLWSVRLKRRLQPAVTRKLFQRFPCKGTTYEYADLVFRSMAGYQLVGSGSIPEVRSTFVPLE